MEFCPNCNAFVNRNTNTCPECGHRLSFMDSLPKSNMPKRRFIKFGIAILVSIIIVVGIWGVFTTGILSTMIPMPQSEIIQTTQSENYSNNLVTQSQDVYTNSLWPCNFNADNSGNATVDCYSKGTFHFRDSELKNTKIDEVRLVWNDNDSYAITQDSGIDNKITYHFGKFVGKENTNNPQSIQTTRITPDIKIATPDNSATPFTNSQLQSNQSTENIDDLRNYALQLINDDRTAKGLSPVKLSNNQAAQIHAEDMFKAQFLSHYMTDGEKPYMVYTRFGGLGDMAQTIAYQAYENRQQCSDPNVICSPIDPKQSIKTSEYNMMYNDQDHNWGHRDNILDKYHTDVSIGIAYDQYSFYITQNFENNYIEYSLPMSEKNGIVSFAGHLKSGSVDNIGIYYDPLPTISTYQQHKDDGFYKLGDQIATVEQPPQTNSYYAPSNSTFEIADKWVQQNNNVYISFDISPLITNPGVYTVVVYLQDNDEPFSVTTYSITKSVSIVQEGFKSSKMHYACTQDQLNQYNQLNQQHDALQQEYDNLPKTATSDQEYQHDMQIYNQLNTMEIQIENFRC